jgi:hypothetical protein
MLSRFDIEVILYDEMERRKRALAKIRKEFDEAVTDATSGLPHPDGSLRISNARKLESAARSSYLVAMRELNRFILDGEIPERLWSSEEPGQKLS